MFKGDISRKILRLSKTLQAQGKALETEAWILCNRGETCILHDRDRDSAERVLRLVSV